MAFDAPAGSTREVLALAIPSSMGYLALMLFETINMFWLAKLGASHVAAVGTMSFLLWIVYGLMSLSLVGTGANVARVLGRGEREIAARHAVAGFWVSVVLGVLIALLLLPLLSPALSWMGMSGEELALGEAFGYPSIACFVLAYLSGWAGQLFQSYGDTRSNAMIMILALLLNAALDPIFIFGYAGPWLSGVRGAAIATLLSQCFALFAKVYVLRRKGWLPAASTFKQLPAWTTFVAYLREGTASSTASVSWSLVYPFLAAIITDFGVAPLAAVNIGHRIEGLPYYVAVGFGGAMLTLISRNRGRGDMPAAARSFWRGWAVLSAFLVPVALLFVGLSEWIFRVLCPDTPEVIPFGRDYLRIVGYFEVLMGWELLCEGACNGLGISRWFMLIATPLTWLRWPLAYVLAYPLGFGVHGVFWAIGLSSALKGLFAFGVCAKYLGTAKRCAEMR